MTLGIRNRNPMNVKQIASDPWYGSNGADESNHTIFCDPIFSVRAGLRTLFQIQKKRNARTLSEYFKIYAPTGDGNDPDAYSAFVAHKLGQSRPDLPMKLFTDNGAILDDYVMVTVVKAVCEFENFSGYEICESIVKSGMALYEKDFVR